MGPHCAIQPKSARQKYKGCAKSEDEQKQSCTDAEQMTSALRQQRAANNVMLRARLFEYARHVRFCEPEIQVTLQEEIS